MLTREVAKRVLDTVDAGLVQGMGVAKPGKMCVEAAVCYALGLPHGDNPACVGAAVRAYKIKLNDSRWSSDAARTKGLRRVAIAQLGSDTLDQREVATRLAIGVVREILPPLCRRYGKEAEAVACEQVVTRDQAVTAARNARAQLRAAYAAAADADAAYAAADAAAYAYAAADDAAAYAAADDARDEVLTKAANLLERVLVEMGSPGAEWLDLADVA